GGPTDTRARTPLVGGLVPVGLRWAWVGLAGSRGADGITCKRPCREELEFVPDDGGSHGNAWYRSVPRHVVPLRARPRWAHPRATTEPAWVAEVDRPPFGTTPASGTE